VTEKLADRRELDTGLEHVYGRRVAQGMWVDTPTVSGCFVVGRMLAKEITNPEPGERPTASVPEYDAIAKVGFDWWLRRDQISK
jgi:hypothetical protein